MVLVCVRALLVLPLIFFLPGYLLLSNLSPRETIESRPPWEIAFISLSFSLLLTSLPALLLAEVGCFSLTKLILVMGLTSLALAILALRRRRIPLPKAIAAGLNEGEAPNHLWLGLILAISAMLFFLPGENIWVGRDAGIYVNTGISLSRSGSLVLRDDFYSALLAETRWSGAISTTPLPLGETSTIACRASTGWTEKTRFIPSSSISTQSG